MSTIKITFTRPVNTDELKEVLIFAENQETTDKETNTVINIDGEYAKITVEVDEDGDFKVL